VLLLNSYWPATTYLLLSLLPLLLLLLLLKATASAYLALQNHQPANKHLPLLPLLLLLLLPFNRHQQSWRCHHHHGCRLHPWLPACHPLQELASSD
jgi:hypothetical protein